ncbi:MAG: hypothetical protein ACKVPJ_04090 [Chitinophagales bacterium]
MRNILRTFIAISFLTLATQQASAQVVMKEYLSSNLDGKIDNAKNNGGKALHYRLEYKETQGARIGYTLHFYKDAGMSKPWISFPVIMRNLQWTYYMDVSMAKDNATKVFAMIYKKDLRWARVKYSPHTGCEGTNPIVWERIDKVEDFASLIKNTLTQMDKNVKLSCYEAK